MDIKFTKMHGIGNDYIYINCVDEIPFDPCRLSEKMSPRHFSVGADGIVLICSSDKADFKMRMFNADGSEGLMCGNAIRCIGKYVYDNGLTNKTLISVETLSGIKQLRLIIENGVVVGATVNMGKADFAPQSLPVIFDGEMINEPVTVSTPIGDITEKLTAVSMGNPHAVCYVDDPYKLDLDKIGPCFENLSIFPDRVNTEFVMVESRNRLVMRVWERGSGETFACGTGACASAAASVKNGLCDFDTDIIIKLRGGELTVRCDREYNITMQGPAEKVYDGVYSYED